MVRNGQCTGQGGLKVGKFRALQKIDSEKKGNEDDRGEVSATCETPHRPLGKTADATFGEPEPIHRGEARRGERKNKTKTPVALGSTPSTAEQQNNSQPAHYK